MSRGLDPWDQKILRELSKDRNMAEEQVLRFKPNLKDGGFVLRYQAKHTDKNLILDINTDLHLNIPVIFYG